jgi:GGDEF domain-containing protein
MPEHDRRETGRRRTLVQGFAPSWRWEHRPLPDRCLAARPPCRARGSRGFKEINDRFGHLNGDQCLRQVAGALKAAVRIPDACFRWGGDEFAVLLAETDRGEAELVGRRLAASVYELCRKPDGEPITLSFGSAELLEDLDGHDLVAAADLALLILRDRTAAGETAG